MTDITDHNHDLEDHIPTLRKLDEARRQSAKLRDEGIKVLITHRKDLLRSPMFDIALTLRALGTKRNQPFEKAKEQEELLGTIFELGKDLQTLTLQDIVDDDLSLLAAARVLRALVACPGAAFSRTALVCYYWITRELYTADGSDWNTGGIRAAPEGSVSAFVTGECVHALLSFAEAQEKTGIFIEKVGEFIERKKHLEQLEKAFDGLAAAWVKVEKDRLYLSFSLTLQRLSRDLVLPIELPPEKLPNEIKSFAEHYIEFSTSKKNLEMASLGFSDFAVNFSTDHLKNAIEKAKKGFEEAKNEIKKYRKNEEKKKKESSVHARALMKSASAHGIAFFAVSDALESVEGALKFFKKNPMIDKECFDGCQKVLNKAAKEVRHLLRPAMNYLDTILDRELSTVSLGEQWDWQPSELACAATAYGRLRHSPGEWAKDRRFGRATEQLSKAISSGGLIPNKRPYHVERDANLHYYSGNSAALTALAQLLRNLNKPEIDPELIAKMLEFFAETRATQPYQDWQFSKEELRKIVRNSNTRGGDVEFAALRKYIPILIFFGRKSALRNNFNSIFSLPIQIAEEKKVIEALWEVMAAVFNQILKDDWLCKNDNFKNFINSIPDNDEHKKQTMNSLIEKLSGKKDSDELVRGNRRLLEYANKEIIMESGAAEFPPDEEVKGWCREHLPIPRKTDLTATAHAVFALAEINEMLDARINKMILEHFSVKGKDKELDAGLTLDSLFYPDYGLLLEPNSNNKKFELSRPKNIEEKDWPEKGIWREKSVAMVLQEMHAHLSRVSLPDEYNPLCSLVLHGPAGTGKTTLVEALAVTCDVPLVEVTPSDLVKRGEENIEQRARAVFEALSMLTRVVILFDEFDPVLKRRDAGNNNPLSVFSFLTPGMLPKLKDLNGRAKKRSVAYVLVTNLIGELDEAAVRQGRFDERLGIYPPDLLSRTGRLLDQLTMYIAENWKKYDLMSSESGDSAFNILIRDDIKLADGECRLSFNKEKEIEQLILKHEGGEFKFKVLESSDNQNPVKCKKEDDIRKELPLLIDAAFLKKLKEGNPVSLKRNSDKVQFDYVIDTIKVEGVVKDTAGKGMTALGKRGWFTRSKKEVEEKTPFGYVLGIDMKKYVEPEPDDALKGIRGEGRTAVTEYLQWKWIEEWDSKFHQSVPDVESQGNASEQEKDRAAFKKLSGVLEAGKKDKENKEGAFLKIKASLPFAQSSSDQWEVMVGRRKPFSCRILIRRSKHDPDKK